MSAGTRALLFDYFFTLVKVEHSDLSAVAAGLSCRASDAELERAVQEVRRVVEPPCYGGDPPPFRSYRDQWTEIGESLFGRFGVAGGGEAWADARAAAHRDAALYAEVVPTLRALRNAGIPIGVVSDADTGYLRDNIAKHKLEFDVVVSSEGRACYKPHKSLFDAACEALRVRPRDCIFVGDSPVTDIEGSRRAGLRPIWINRRGLAWPEDLEPCELSIDSLDEVLAVVSSPR